MDLLSDIEKQLKQTTAQAFLIALSGGLIPLYFFLYLQNFVKNNRTYRLYLYEQSTFITD